MIKICITGNIASGKSFALDFFKSCSFKTLCLDELTHSVYLYPSVSANIIKLFGTIDRKIISDIVFHDKNKLQKLENIIHPEVKIGLDKFFVENIDERLVFVSVPILFETGFDVFFDKIIFISCSEDIRIRRLMKRNNLSYDNALLRIRSQMNEELKIPKSDYVIYNNGTLEEFKSKLKELKDILL